jgi:hypothetical protein
MELVPLVDVVVVRGSEDSGWRGESWRLSEAKDACGTHGSKTINMNRRTFLIDSK